MKARNLGSRKTSVKKKVNYEWYYYILFV
jgi:hypothetical protein